MEVLHKKRENVVWLSNHWEPFVVLPQGGWHTKAFLALREILLRNWLLVSVSCIRSSKKLFYVLLFSCRNQIESHSFAVVMLIYRTGQSVENLKKKHKPKNQTSTKYYCCLQNKCRLSYLELAMCMGPSINNSLP